MANTSPSTQSPVQPVVKLEAPERAPGLRELPNPRETVRAAQRLGRRKLMRWTLLALGPLVVIALGLYVYLVGGRYVSTDDAYVQAAEISISSDIPGRVVAVAVADNQPVKKGQLLFQLDDRSLRIAVEDAEARLANARLEIAALKAVYRQKQADLESVQDTLAYRQREFDRQKRLLGTGVASQAQFDQASNALSVARQQVAATQEQIASTLANLGGNPDIPTDQHPTVQQAQAQLDRAKLNLSYTIVEAPDDGIVTKVERLQAGDYINAATPLFSLLSTRRIWVEGNFKEVDLTHMRAGQRATIDVDTYPDKTFTATVVSLSPGTGSVFSLLPAQNSSGNWVKVVQRLPVRLAIADMDPAMPLHAGLSATVEVDTGHKRTLGALWRWIWPGSKPSQS